MSLLVVDKLTKSFSRSASLFARTAKTTPAVSEVSFSVDRGETFALVGESGAGKSTTGRLVLRLIEPDSGSVVFDGVKTSALSAKNFKPYRRRMQMIFQDVYGSLDPRVQVGHSVGEPLRVHFGMKESERLKRAEEMLDKVGLGRHLMQRYPGELSGGQLQRVSIARALTLEPDLIVCDEPVAALDVSIRAQVLNLMSDLQDEFGLAYLFVTHDLSLVEAIADHVAVMRNGRVVETGTLEHIFDQPQHEYTKMLLDAVPHPVPPGLQRERDAAKSVIP